MVERGDTLPIFCHVTRFTDDFGLMRVFVAGVAGLRSEVELSPCVRSGSLGDQSFRRCWGNWSWDRLVAALAGNCRVLPGERETGLRVVRNREGWRFEGILRMAKIAFVANRRGRKFSSVRIGMARGTHQSAGLVNRASALRLMAFAAGETPVFAF